MSLPGLRIPMILTSIGINNLLYDYFYDTKICGILPDPDQTV